VPYSSQSTRLVRPGGKGRAEAGGPDSHEGPQMPSDIVWPLFLMCKMSRQNQMISFTRKTTICLT
jgi:hypothetical protein